MKFFMRVDIVERRKILKIKILHKIYSGSIATTGCGPPSAGVNDSG